MAWYELRPTAVSGEPVENATPCQDICIGHDRIGATKEQIASEDDVALWHADNEVRCSMTGVKFDDRRQATKIDLLREICRGQRLSRKRQRGLLDRLQQPGHLPKVA